MFLAEARPRIAAEFETDDDRLPGLHRRFEVVPGAQAQVDWGDEGAILLEGLRLSGMEFSLDRTLLLFLFCCIAEVESR